MDAGRRARLHVRARRRNGARGVEGGVGERLRPAPPRAGRHGARSHARPLPRLHAVRLAGRRVRLVRHDARSGVRQQVLQPGRRHADRADKSRAKFAKPAKGILTRRHEGAEPKRWGEPSGRAENRFRRAERQQFRLRAARVVARRLAARLGPDGQFLRRLAHLRRAAVRPPPRLFARHPGGFSVWWRRGAPSRRARHSLLPGRAFPALAPRRADHLLHRLPHRRSRLGRVGGGRPERQGETPRDRRKPVLFARRRFDRLRPRRHGFHPPVRSGRRSRHDPSRPPRRR